MRTRMITTMALVAGSTLITSGCGLFSGGAAGDVSPTPSPQVTTSQGVTPDGGASDVDSVDATGPDDWNYPDRPLTDTHIRIGVDVYTTNDWEPPVCERLEGGIRFEAQLVGPEHDTRMLFGQIGMTSEPDLVAVMYSQFDGPILAWAIQGIDAEGHTVGSFGDLVADPDAGYVMGDGMFEAVVEHMMPAMDPSSFHVAAFTITCP